MGRVAALCISEKKGTQKHQVEQAEFSVQHGINGDAHAGTWHRQISLLSYEKIEEFRNRGADVAFGAFGENMVVTGFDLRKVPVGSIFQVGTVRLEVTQIGKNCHSHCEIYKKMGDCIMPREGIFARVISGGTVSAGDEITLVSGLSESPFRAAVITLSDKGSKGEREDKSGPLIRERLEQDGYIVEETILLPDDRRVLEMELSRLADQRQIDLVLTTGGTGFSPRDITPEATIAVCDRMAPGIAEAIRVKSLEITNRAMLSRAASGIRKRTLIVNLPGSPKAVSESLDVIMPAMKHGLGILRGTDGECGK